MSFGEEADGKRKSTARPRVASRRLDQAAVGETVRFLTHPIVKNRSGSWVPAPSLDAVVVYTICDSPFVKFLLDDGRKTDAKWVGASLLIEAASTAAPG